MNSTSLKYLRAAKQRLTTAEFLGTNDYNLDAMYLTGYSIECSLKALILDRTPESARLEMIARIARGSNAHSFEVLAGLLKDLIFRFPQISSDAASNPAGALILGTSPGEGIRGW